MSILFYPTSNNPLATTTQYIKATFKGTASETLGLALDWLSNDTIEQVKKVLQMDGVPQLIVNGANTTIENGPRAIEYTIKGGPGQWMIFVDPYNPYYLVDDEFYLLVVTDSPVDEKQNKN